MKLATRFFLMFTAIALVPLLLAGLWQFYQQKQMRRTITDLHLRVTDFAASGVDDWFAGVNRRLSFVYDIEHPRRGQGAAEEMKIIQQAVAANSDIISLAVLGQDRRETMRLHDSKVDPAELPSDYSADPLVLEVSSSGMARAGAVTMLGGYPVLSLGYPLPDSRMIIMNFSLAQLWKRLESQTIGETGKVLISGADGVPLPAQPGVMDKLSGIIKKAGDGGRTGIIDEGGYAGAFHRVEALPWTVVSLQSRSEAFGAQERSFYGFLFFAAISLFASLGL